jgi:hypothetical protein
VCYWKLCTKGREVCSLFNYYFVIFASCWKEPNVITFHLRSVLTYAAY